MLFPTRSGKEIHENYVSSFILRSNCNSTNTMWVEEDIGLDTCHQYINLELGGNVSNNG